MHQHQQYPGMNSIPGMHTINHMSGISSLHGIQTMPALQSFSNLPGISAMPSLLHPPTDGATSAPPPPPPPPPPPLSSSHLSNHFQSTSLLSGAVEKPRKPRKPRNVYASVLPGDDTNVMMSGHGPPHVAPHVDTGLSSTTPVYEADGIQFKILDQLPDAKIQRLRSEKIKPIEQLTFSDIKAYNRNQLRAYCSVYGIRRKKKAEMERDMARYAALFHVNDPDYDIGRFEPTEYADGPIPRRKVPVTKEQKEQAAGDFKQLTNALHQRPTSGSTSSGGLVGNPHFPPLSAHATHGHHGLGGTHPLHSASILAPPRLHDIHATGGHLVGVSGGIAHAHHGVGPGHGGHHVHEGEHDGTNGVSAPELMTVPEMQLPQHLLSISHQMGEE